MKFSLLMPTLGRPSLSAAVQAVLDQMYQRWELLISPWPDQPVGIPDDPRIVVMKRRSENVCEALNDMLNTASGEVFAVTADDDLLDCMALSAVATYLRSNPWLVGRIRTNGDVFGGPCKFQDLLYANLISLPAVFWTRQAAMETGRFNPDHPFCFDYDYWVRMWKACGPPRFIDNVLSEYGSHPGQVTNAYAEAVRKDAETVRAKYVG